MIVINYLKSPIILFLLFAVCELSQAQQSKVDSIITFLNASNTESGIDSAKFYAALGILNTTQLNDVQIAQIEKASELLCKEAECDYSYLLKYTIFYNLIRTDKTQAISYGTYQFEQLGKSKDAIALYARSDFYRALRLPYRNSNRLSEGFQFFNEQLKVYKQNNDSVGLADSYYVLAGFYDVIGLVDQAIYNLKKSLSYMDTISEGAIENRLFLKPNDKNMWLNNIAVLGFYYLENGDYPQVIKYSAIAFKANFKKNDNSEITFESTSLAMAYQMMDQLDSGFYYLDIAIKSAEKAKSYDNLVCALQVKILYKIKTNDLADIEPIINKCWKLIDENKIPLNPPAGTVAPDYYLALLKIKQNKIAEAIELLTKDIVRLSNQRLNKLRDYKLLAQLYEQSGKTDKANDAHKTFISIQDSLLADQNKYRSLSFETEQQMSETEKAMLSLKSQNKIASLTRNYLLGIAVLLILIAIGIYMRFRSKKIANVKLEKAYSDLKSTQQQLIQSEKLAALGTVATRMAHEIQNPLNFVNNFSELSEELVHEIVASKDEEEKADAAKALLENLQKINQHGKRASGIVKQLQEHSNKGTAHEFFESQRQDNGV